VRGTFSKVPRNPNSLIPKRPPLKRIIRVVPPYRNVGVVSRGVRSKNKVAVKFQAEYILVVAYAFDKPLLRYCADVVEDDDVRTVSGCVSVSVKYDAP
jgi:hypothetical protein